MDYISKPETEDFASRNVLFFHIEYGSSLGAFLLSTNQWGE